MNFEIISKKIDYLKFIIYRERLNITVGDQVNCVVVKQLIDQFKLDDLFHSTQIYNNNGIGIFGRLKNKIFIDFRGLFFLKYSYQEIQTFVNFLIENKLDYKITRKDIAIDYTNNSLLPFTNELNIFGKMRPGTIFIPKKFRGDLLSPTEYVLMRNKSILTFYDKTKEIKYSKKQDLYPEIYKSGQVFRCELKLLRIDEKFNSSEKDLVNTSLKEWYIKNKFSGRENTKIKKIFYF